MKTAVIRSSWMGKQGYRLDCQPYLGGALETIIILENLPFKTEKLSTLTAGFDGGIYNGPQFVRNYVEAREFGVPFMTGSTMQLADISTLPLLSRRDAESPKLRHLQLSPRMSLISCSGTIGKMVYSRRDMAGVWSSQDVLKVVADPSRISEGYLYAYLSSKFGIPLIASGTYGAIIQHLEPEHIANVPVPRLGNLIEQQIHDQIEAASELRAKAFEQKFEAIRAFTLSCGLSQLPPAEEYPSPRLGTATSNDVSERMDGTYYIPSCMEARREFDNAGRQWEAKSLSDVAEVFIPTIFKRQYADDPAEGYPYVTGADVFCIRPTSSQYLMRRVAIENRLLLKNGMIVLHEAGQRYGLIGRAVMIGRTLDGFACTNNMVRITAKDPAESGFIFAVLSSEHGIRLLKREAAGSSIPHLEARRVASIKIPWPDRKIRARVAALADEARENWDLADELERKADEKLVDALTNTVN